jgi:hypothetical protein
VGIAKGLNSTGDHRCLSGQALRDKRELGSTVDGGWRKLVVNDLVLDLNQLRW